LCNRDDEFDEIGVRLLPEGFLAASEEVVQETGNPYKGIGFQVVVQRIVPVSLDRGKQNLNSICRLQCAVALVLGRFDAFDIDNVVSPFHRISPVARDVHPHNLGYSDSTHVPNRCAPQIVKLEQDAEKLAQMGKTCDPGNALIV
jgi:hypothetical protein